MFAILRCWVLISSVLLPLGMWAQGLDTTKIDGQLGRSGQKTGDVYKVGFPRTDLQVSVHGLAIKPGLALGSWAAFTGTDDNAMVMGDLVLLEDEVNPVMAKLRSADFEISAVHNHLIEETPHVMYMHYMGHGIAAQLAASLRSALAASKTPLAADEVNPVISELETHRILVTALHSHMLAEQPRLFFMHFWSVGSPESVGAGIKAALGHVSIK
jgi:hypothetical protein